VEWCFINIFIGVYLLGGAKCFEQPLSLYFIFAKSLKLLNFSKHKNINIYLAFWIYVTIQIRYDDVNAAGYFCSQKL